MALYYKTTYGRGGGTWRIVVYLMKLKNYSAKIEFRTSITTGRIKRILSTIGIPYTEKLLTAYTPHHTVRRIKRSTFLKYLKLVP